jgi:hypothetical protein
MLTEMHDDDDAPKHFRAPREFQLQRSDKSAKEGFSYAYQKETRQENSQKSRQKSFQETG